MGSPGAASPCRAINAARSTAPANHVALRDAQRPRGRGGDRGFVKAGQRVHFLWLIVVQKAAGRRVAADLGAVVEQTRSRQLMQHERAEAADRTLLRRDQNLVLAAEPGDERGIQRLGEARAGDRRRKP